MFLSIQESDLWFFGSIKRLKLLEVSICSTVPIQTVTAKIYQKGFTRIRTELNLNPEHRPHDGRTHFVTAAKKAGVDEYAIKYMVGHKISDITEKVYTKREFEWLKEEIEKLK